MIEPIRQATPEEIEKIKAGSDLTAASNVLVFPQGEGKDPMMAVLRQCYELDPVYYAGVPMQKKLVFLWGLENMLRFAGVREYYFNVPASDEEYQGVLQHWGAEQISKEPEFRFKKGLV